MIIILSILWVIGVLIWDLLSDFKKWKKDIPVKHTDEALLRVLILLPAIAGFSAPDFDPLTMVSAAAMIFSWWWEFFDGFYNKLRGFSWRFNGSHDDDDPVLDEFLYKFSAKQQMLLKWSLIILTTILYIIL